MSKAALPLAMMYSVIHSHYTKMEGLIELQWARNGDKDDLN